MSHIVRAPPDPPFDTTRSIRNHGLLASIAFLVLIPLGTLIARYFRTFTTKWWLAHSLLNSFVTGPLVIVSWVKASQLGNDGGFNASRHTTIGSVIFGLYIAQVVLGIFIHYVHLSFPFGPGHRPPQNYIHALLGLVILALAEYQVHDGIYVEWPKFTGNSPINESAKPAWLALMIIFWCLYAVGLLFLPRQYRQERQGVEPQLDSEKR